MTQEEKQLLLIDLCARLPHGVKVQSVGENKILGLADLFNSDLFLPKPYLRPMSSMTEEDAFEMFNVIYPNITPLTFESLNDGIKFTGTNKEGDYLRIVLLFNKVYSLEQIDWLNAHHFDYRGLIEKGLALEAPEDMYETE